METGKIKFFNENKGFGFIAPDDGSKDVFVHATGLVDQNEAYQLKEDTKVEFERGTDQRTGKEKALNVRLLH